MTVHGDSNGCLGVANNNVTSKHYHIRQGEARAIKESILIRVSNPTLKNIWGDILNNSSEFQVKNQ